MFNPFDRDAPQIADLPQWTVQPQEPRGGWLTSGLATIPHELAGLGGYATQGVGRFLGLPGVETAGKSFADQQMQAAQAAGRPDLETPPWRQNGAPWLPYIGYQAAKNAPLMAAQMVAGALVPEALVPEALASAGAIVPRLLGGGAGEATAAAAAQVGKQWARNVTGAAVAGYPAAVGSMVQEANQRGPLTDEDTNAALGMGVPYAMLDAIQPAQVKALGGAVTKGGGKEVAKEVLKTFVAGAAEEVPQEALQTAMEQSFRPDLPMDQKVQNVIDAALTGGLIGGVMGGGAGVVSAARSMTRVDANEITTNDLDTVTKAELEPEEAPDEPIKAQQAAEPAPVEEAPIEQPAAPPSEFAELDDPQLLNVAKALNPDVPEEAARLQDVYAEMQSRLEQREQEAQPTERTGPSPRDEMMAIGGKRAKMLRFFKNEVTDQTSMPEALSKLRTYYDNGSNWTKRPIGMRDIMQSYGLADVDGNPINLDAKVNDLTKKIDRASAKVEKNPGLAKNITLWTQDRDRLSKLRDMWSQADAHEKQAPAENDVRKDAGYGEAVRIDDTKVPTGESWYQNPREEGPAVEGQVGQIQSPAVESVVQEDAANPQGNDVTAVETVVAKSEKFKKLAEQSRAAQQALDAGKALTPEEWNAKYPENPVNFKAATEPSTKSPLSAKAFDTAFGGAMKEIGASANDRVTVVNTPDELPARIRKDAARQKLVLDAVHGVIDKGKVYVVKSNMRSPQDVYKVLRHEILGHGGAEKLFGAGYKDTLAGVYDRAGGIKELTKTARQMGAELDISNYFPADVRSGERSVDALTEREKAKLTDELLANVSEGVSPEQLDQLAGPQKSKLRKAVGAWVNKLKTALIRTLQKAGLNKFAQHLQGYSTQEMAGLLREMHAAARSDAPDGQGTAYKLETPQDMNDAAKAVVTRVTDALPKVNLLDLKGDALSKVLSMFSFIHIAEEFGNMFDLEGARNPFEAYWQGNKTRDITKARVAGLFVDAHSAILSAPKRMQELISRAMVYQGLEIDPEKTWEKQTWLHDKSNAQQLKAIVREANGTIQALKDGNAYEAYHAAKVFNEMMGYAAEAQAIYRGFETDPLFAHVPKRENPTKTFLATAAVHTNLASARDFWKKEALEQYKAANAAVKALSKNAQRTQKQQTLFDTQSLPMKKLLEHADAFHRRLERMPYFHLGRQGDYMVSFHFAKDKDGGVDPNTVGLVQKTVYDSGFKDVVISEAANQPYAFIRVNTRQQAEELFQIMSKLQDEGKLGKEAIKRGDRFNENLFGKLTPEWIDRIVERVENSFPSKEEMAGMEAEEVEDIENAKKSAVAQVKGMLIDLMPDMNISKVLVKREYIPGYSSDMIRSFAFRAMVGTNALANMAASADVTDALRGMRQAIEVAKSERSNPNVFTMQQVYREISTRETTRPPHVDNDIIDTLRAVNYGWNLGGSVSFATLNSTQLGVLGWPELAKHHGFMRSAQELAKASSLAMKIVSAVMRSGWKEGNFKWADAVISHTVMDEVFGNKDTPLKVALMTAINSGFIDLGGPAREQARAAEGRLTGPIDVTLRMASSFGYYTETFTRLATAIAAHELYAKKPVKGFANVNAYMEHVVNQSMLEYSPTNTARIFQKNSPLGRWAPLPFAFMNYQAQVLEKLYREFSAAAGGSPEARRFVAAHLGAMVVLTGTLGLPFATVAAAAFDKLKDLISGDDDEPTDIKSAWRNFLSDTFGKDVGEVLAHGLPRAAGFDISKRAGEQDILPFSKFLADRRAWKDRVKDAALEAFGAPGSMISNFVDGSMMIMDGDVLSGMKQMMPVAIKGGIEAYRMTQDGYVDSKGRKLPLETPEVHEILAQALGFTPANKAEYMEHKQVNAVAKDVSLQRAGVIRRRLVDAIERGDETEISKWTETANRFGEAHPAYDVRPSIARSAARRASDMDRATLLHQPLGTSAKEARPSRTDWANWQ